MMQNSSGLNHLYHEGALASCQVILGAYTCEYTVHHSDSGCFGWNIATDLSHQYNQRNLAQIRRFARHVRSSDNEYLCIRDGNLGIVGNKRSFCLRLLDHGMTTSHSVYAISIVEPWTTIVVLRCYSGQA